MPCIFWNSQGTFTQNFDMSVFFSSEHLNAGHMHYGVLQCCGVLPASVIVYWGAILNEQHHNTPKLGARITAMCSNKYTMLWGNAVTQLSTLLQCRPGEKRCTAASVILIYNTLNFMHECSFWGLHLVIRWFQKSALQVFFS